MPDAPPSLDDVELARRAVRSFGELLATLADHAAAEPAAADLARLAAGAAAVRRPDTLGARFPAVDSPWVDAAVVPFGAAPPTDDAALPRYLWAAAEAVPGRVERRAIAMPCMSLRLDAPPASSAGGLPGAAPDMPRLEQPSLEELGDDLGVHYVATPPSHQRRGLATALLLALLTEARAAGLRTASLQASPAGAPVYERLGFRRVTALRAFARAG